MNKLKIALPLLFCSVLLSCKKEAGPGGLASVKGKVYEIDLTNTGDTISMGYMGDLRVYIGAADGSVAFDDMRTSYDGSYQFDFLRKGSYKVWVFAKSDTAASKPDFQEYFVQDVEISDKKGEAVVPDFIVNI